VVPARAGTVHGNSDRDAGRRISASAASAPARSRRWTPRFHSALDNAFYVIDSNTVELGYFCLRHSIARQGSNAAELGGRYLACLAPGRRFSPFRLRFDVDFGFRGIRRSWWWDRKNTRLSPGLLAVW